MRKVFLSTEARGDDIDAGLRGTYPFIVGVVQMSLQFNVSLLSQEEIGAVREHPVDCRILVGDEPSPGQVTGDVALMKTTDGILATAQLTGEQAQQCSRCLKGMMVPLKLKVKEEFLLSVDPVSGSRLKPPADPDRFRVSATHVLDMDEAVRQTWTAALPIQPLCKPECMGLCSECGQDLNEGKCSCSPVPDERWGALRELAQNLKGTS